MIVPIIRRNKSRCRRSISEMSGLHLLESFGVAYRDPHCAGVLIAIRKPKMSLNVKDPEAHRLAQARAQETGETLTRAVTEALRERYQRLHKRDCRGLQLGAHPQPNPQCPRLQILVPRSSAENLVCSIGLVLVVDGSRFNSVLKWVLITVFEK